MYNQLPQNFMLTAMIILSYLLILSVRNLARDQLDDFSSPHGINSVTWRCWTDGWPGLNSPRWSIPGILVGWLEWSFFPFDLGTSLHILSWWLRILYVITPRGLKCQDVISTSFCWSGELLRPTQIQGERELNN